MVAVESIGDRSGLTQTRIPAKVVQKQSTVNGSNMSAEKYDLQPRVLEPSAMEESSSGGTQLTMELVLSGFLHESSRVLS